MSIVKQRFTATHSQSTTECVLLHGWGMSSVVWATWLPVVRRHCHVTVLDLPGYGLSEPMDYSDWETLFACCVEGLPESAVYIGYSLGGMLALNIAKYYPERVRAVVTLASNLKFVADSQWTQAMARKTFDTFYADVKHNPQHAVKRFLGLQVRGAAQEISLLKMLRSNADKSIPSVDTLTQSLDCLAAIDNRRLASELDIPLLLLFGQNDQLVPVGVTKRFKEKMKENTIIIDEAPHCLFLSDPESTWAEMRTFLLRERIALENEERSLDKKQVARSFSRAASTYDSVADLQRRVGHHLHTYLPKQAADVVLDLGCGTGFFCESLQQHFPDSQLIGLDLAEGMVSFACDHHQCRGVNWLCGDAESLPLADASVDVIFSSLAIQWCEDIDSLFVEINRVLKPDGSFVVSTLGPDTLHELRDAWQAVDDYVHVNQFVSQDLLIKSAQRSGLACAIECRQRSDSLMFEEQTITLEYDTLKHLTRELKALGAHNVNHGRPSGLMGKQGLHAFMQAYECQRNEQHRLPASYQVWYGKWSKRTHTELID